LTKILCLLSLAILLLFASVYILSEENYKQLNRIELLQRDISVLAEIILVQNKRIEDLEYIQGQGASPEISNIILTKSFQYGFDSALIARLIKAESNFKINAKHKVTGATGLMQVTPSTARLYNFTLTNNPEDNISQGLYILSDKLKEYGTIEKALASYHGGHLRGKYWGTLRINQGKTLYYVNSIIGGK
jgi:soluble lytic murein transglycosylase-like protein